MDSWVKIEDIPTGTTSIKPFKSFKDQNLLKVYSQTRCRSSQQWNKLYSLYYIFLLNSLQNLMSQYPETWSKYTFQENRPSKTL